MYSPVYSRRSFCVIFGAAGIKKRSHSCAQKALLENDPTEKKVKKMKNRTLAPYHPIFDTVMDIATSNEPSPGKRLLAALEKHEEIETLPLEHLPQHVQDALIQLRSDMRTRREQILTNGAGLAILHIRGLVSCMDVDAHELYGRRP